MDKHLIPTPRRLADIDVRSRELIGRGWGKLERLIFRHRRFDDTWSAEVTRDIYTIGEVAMVLPYDPALDAVLLIEQFRACGLVWGEATWLFEAVAGIIDAGETPTEVATREAREEADCKIGTPIHISTVWSSPAAMVKGHTSMPRRPTSQTSAVSTDWQRNRRTFAPSLCRWPKPMPPLRMDALQMRRQHL